MTWSRFTVLDYVTINSQKQILVFERVILASNSQNISCKEFFPEVQIWKQKLETRFSLAKQKSTHQQSRAALFSLSINQSVAFLLNWLIRKTSVVFLFKPAIKNPKIFSLLWLPERSLSLLYFPLMTEYLISRGLSSLFPAGTAGSNMFPLTFLSPFFQGLFLSVFRLNSLFVYIHRYMFSIINTLLCKCQNRNGS